MKKNIDGDLGPNKPKFEYGNSIFSRAYRLGVFHVDKTIYITLLEGASDLLIFLRSRRMRSLLVSMLEHYYDIKYKDQFQELFGHLYIGQKDSVTREHNSYSILKLNFFEKLT
jgi:hypothetical protein